MKLSVTRRVLEEHATIRQHFPETRPQRANALLLDWDTILRLTMKSRFILFRRKGVYYAEDTTTRKQYGLRTKDGSEEQVLLNAKNESFRQPVLNLQIARAYLTASDPAVSTRTWQTVMDQMQTHGKDSS